MDSRVLKSLIVAGVLFVPTSFCRSDDSEDTVESRISWLELQPLRLRSKGEGAIWEFQFEYWVGNTDENGCTTWLRSVIEKRDNQVRGLLGQENGTPFALYSSGRVVTIAANCSNLRSFDGSFLLKLQGGSVGGEFSSFVDTREAEVDLELGDFIRYLLKRTSSTTYDHRQRVLRLESRSGGHAWIRFSRDRLQRSFPIESMVVKAKTGPAIAILDIDIEPPFAQRISPLPADAIAGVEKDDGPAVSLMERFTANVNAQRILGSSIDPKMTALGRGMLTLIGSDAAVSPERLEKIDRLIAAVRQAQGRPDQRQSLSALTKYMCHFLWEESSATAAERQQFLLPQSYPRTALHEL